MPSTHQIGSMDLAHLHLTQLFAQAPEWGSGLNTRLIVALAVVVVLLLIVLVLLQLGGDDERARGPWQAPEEPGGPEPASADKPAAVEPVDTLPLIRRKHAETERGQTVPSATAGPAPATETPSPVVVPSPEIMPTPRRPAAKTEPRVAPPPQPSAAEPSADRDTAENGAVAPLSPHAVPTREAVAVAPAPEVQSASARAPAVTPVVAPPIPVTEPSAEPVEQVAEPVVEPELAPAPEPVAAPEPVVEPKASGFSAAAPVPEPAAAPEPDERAAITAEALPAVRAELKSVLLVENSVTMRTVVEMVLATEPYALTTLDGGAEACARARELKPDLVIADLSLDDTDGYAICSELRGDAELGDTPVLLLHGSAVPIDSARAAEVGASGDLLKPFRSDDLLEQVKALTSGQTSGDRN